MAMSAKQRAQMNNRNPDGTFKSAKKVAIVGGSGRQRKKPKVKNG